MNTLYKIGYSRRTVADFLGLQEACKPAEEDYGTRPAFLTANYRSTGHIIQAAITEIERARGILDAATISDDWIDSMRSRAFLLEAHHTTHIEGTRLTVEDAENLLAGRAVPETDPEDVRELLNYRDAFEYVSAYPSSGGPITERLILEINARLVTGVRE